MDQAPHSTGSGARPDASHRASRLAIVLLVLFLAVAAWFRPLDLAAGERVDAGLKTAFATFATARALNAGISLLQSAQISAQLGVGVSAHPGELLDPLNDLIEQFSNFMLAATVAFGIQKVLLALGAHWVVPGLLGVVAIGWSTLMLRGRARPWLLSQALALLLLVRFAVPIASLGSDVLFQTFLEPGYQASQRSLEQIEGQTDAIASAESADADTGMLATLRQWLAKGVDLSAQARKISQAASQLAEELTRLMVAFTLQTLVFPLALIWLMVQAMRSLLRPQ